MVNSRNKGKRGELNLVKALKSEGFDTHRGQQYCGANGDADIVGLVGIHPECKWVERLNMTDAMSQAISDARDGEMPAVFHKKNNEPWKVTMLLVDWSKLYREWLNGALPETEIEYQIYKMFCDGCEKEKHCHETCTHCDMVAAVRAFERLK